MTGDYFGVTRARPTRCRVTFTTSAGQTHQAQTDQVGTWPTG